MSKLVLTYTERRHGAVRNALWVRGSSPSLPNTFYQTHSPCTLRLALIFCILVFSIEHFSQGGGQNEASWLDTLKPYFTSVWTSAIYCLHYHDALKNSFLTIFREFMTIIYQIDSLRPFDL